MSSQFRIALLATLTMALSACGWFSGKDETLEPAELVDIETRIDIKKLWSAKVGGDAEFLRVMLRPAGDGNRVYAASRNGNVVAFNPDSGKQIWKTDLDAELSAGPGVGDGLVAVGSANGVIIVLNADSGKERWRINLGGETLSPPLIEDDLVLVATIDNRLYALSAFDGSQSWVAEQTTPVLTLRGSATPVVVGNTVVAGFDNGRLLGISLDSGDPLWETVLAPPSGRTDLERLADIDGQITSVGQDVYAAGYQGNIAALASESGQLLWSREISTYVGVAADWNTVYTTNTDGEIVALARRNGQEVWRQSSLLRREPTVPVPFNRMVAVGDLDGYLHFFSVLDGSPMARVRAGGAAISGVPTVIGDRLFVQTDAGNLAAYTVVKPKAKPRPAVEETAPAAEESATDDD